MKIKMTINKIKSIENLEIYLPIQRGLFAITGQNGSGKSTLTTCVSSLFFNMKMKDYFGKTENDSFIEFELGSHYRKYSKDHSGKWFRQIRGGRVDIYGFYEGSLIYGNRFRNTNYNTLKKLEYINESLLVETDNFIKENLGLILHNNNHFYEKILKAPEQVLRNNGIYVSGDIFYYKKGNKIVSQFYMSTGENLLVSILNSLLIRINDRKQTTLPSLLLLDEIELALHPSSLKRLLTFLKSASKQYRASLKIPYYFSLDQNVIL